MTDTIKGQLELYDGIADMPVGPSTLEKPGQRSLFDPADFGKKPKRDTAWKDELWATEGHLAMQCIDARQAHVDSFRKGAAPPISEPKIAALTGQHWVYVHRRLQAAKQRKVMPGLENNHGYWSVSQSEAP